MSKSQTSVAFKAIATDGQGTLDGIWLAEPDGQMNLIPRAGDLFDIGGGVLRQPYAVSFGTDPETIAGPEDGRRCPINDRGEILFVAGWQNPPGPPDFGSYGFGLFVARRGLRLSAEIAGNGPSCPGTLQPRRRSKCHPSGESGRNCEESRLGLANPG